MTRYLRLVLGLGILATVYWQLGGFATTTDASRSDAPAEAAQTSHAAIADTTAYGGPDDGPSFGFPPIKFESKLASAFKEDFRDWEELRIGRNESFYVALQRVGLDHDTIMSVVRAAEPHTDLRKVRRDDRFLLSREEGVLQAIRFDLDEEHYLVVRAIEGETTAEIARYPIQRLLKAAQGTILTNLFDALKAEKIDPVLADQLAEILGWDIDFFRDLRVGDRFRVLYAEYVHEGQSVRDPEVLSVHFVNKGKEVRAYRYDNAFDLPAYYKTDGSSLERQFLRAPLKFTRISSNFSYKRLHPILKRYRPHWGVDYAAPVGTPVHATADGTVIKRSRDKGSGNFVGLRHGNGYESYYLHLSRFAKIAQPGTKVRQGDVIGFVGKTGWATGPHLDYRIKRNGKWVNPRKLALPPADPISETELAAFRSRVESLDAYIGALPDDLPVIVLESSLAPATEVELTR